jgi:hypothetical protein
VIGVSRNNYQVRSPQPLQARVGLERETGLRPKGARLTGHDGEVVGGQAVIGPVDSEHLAGHAQP